jgi:hypothetical protein
MRSNITIRAVEEEAAKKRKKEQQEQNEVDLNSRGRPRRGVVSFQIEMSLWREFDRKVEDEYGKYKKSYIIENLIRKFMQSQKKIDLE